MVWIALATSSPIFMNTPATAAAPNSGKIACNALPTPGIMLRNRSAALMLLLMSIPRIAALVACMLLTVEWPVFSTASARTCASLRAAVIPAL